LDFDGVMLDTVADRLAFRLRAPANDLSRLNASLRFPQKFEIEGTLGPLDMACDGKLSLAGGTLSGSGSGAIPRAGAARPQETAPQAMEPGTAQGTGRSDGKPPAIGATNLRLRSGTEGSDDFHMLDIRFDRADIDLAAGRFSIAGLTVGAPPRFQEKDPVRVGKIGVVAKLDSLASSLIEMPEITVEDTDVAFEFNMSGTNIGRILAELDHFAARMSGPTWTAEGGGTGAKPGSGAGKAAATGGASGGSASTPVLIRKLKTSGMSLRISQSLLKEGSSLIPKKTLPPIEVDELRSDNLLAAVPAVARCVLAPAIEAGRDLAFSVRDFLRASGEAMAKDFGKKAAESAGAVKEMEKNVRDIGRDLRGIFQPEEKKTDAKKPEDEKPVGEKPAKEKPKSPEAEKPEAGKSPDGKKAETPADGKAGTEKEKKKKKRD
ncbi:MAG: hypothetical protein N3A38_16570, partial [Planctomycetota bacterium]|nr:hypothetical protein [Planctomycetota bacterium]